MALINHIECSGNDVSVTFTPCAGEEGPGRREPGRGADLRRERRPEEEREPQLPADVGQGGRGGVAGQVGPGHEGRLQEHGLRRQEPRQGKRDASCLLGCLWKILASP